MSSPPWRDVIITSYCPFNAKGTRVIDFSPCMPACPGATYYDTPAKSIVIYVLESTFKSINQVWARGLGQGFKTFSAK